MSSPQFPISEVVGINTLETACGVKNTTTIFTRIYPFAIWIGKFIVLDNGLD